MRALKFIVGTARTAVRHLRERDIRARQSTAFNNAKAMFWRYVGAGIARLVRVGGLHKADEADEHDSSLLTHNPRT